jgi:hypothetical protein
MFDGQIMLLEDDEDSKLIHTVASKNLNMQFIKKRDATLHETNYIEEIFLFSLNAHFNVLRRIN